MTRIPYIVLGMLAWMGGWPAGVAWAEEKELRVITEIWAPFSYKENGEVKGVVTDIVREAFKRLDVPIHLQVMPWKRAVMTLKKGKGDALYSASYKKERTEFLVYPKHPIYRVRYLFYSKRGSGFHFDGDVRHLRGSIGAMRGYSYTSEFWNTPKHCGGCYRIEEVNRLEQNFEKLRKGAIVAFPAAQKVAEAMIAKKGYGDAFVASEIPLATKDYYLAFRKGMDPQLIERFDEVLEQLKQESGTELVR